MKDIINYYKENIKNCLKDYKSKKTIVKQIPNLLTLYRIISIIPFNILFLSNNIYPALAVLSTSFISDFFDGKIARHFNATSKFGADLDAISDKLLLVGTIIPTIITNPIITLNLIMETIISTINIKRKFNGENPQTVFIGKIKTFLLSITIIMSYVNLYANVSTLIPYLIGTTLLTQIVTSYKYIKQSKMQKQEGLKANKIISNTKENIEKENIKQINHNYQYSTNPKTIEEKLFNDEEKSYQKQKQLQKR